MDRKNIHESRGLLAVTLLVVLSGGMRSFAQTTGDASAADYRANSNPNKFLSPGAVWTAVNSVVLTDAATVIIDFNTGLDFWWQLGGNRTMGNPTNLKVGQKGVIWVIQDGTGGRTITWGTNWKFPGGVKPTLSAASGALDMISYVGGSAGLVYCTYSLGFA